MTDLAVDYAWQHPAPQAIKTVGYKAVLRYLSPDPTKNLTVTETTALHAVGLGILLVWEAGAQSSLGGAAQGAIDGAAAEALAVALGYPAQCPIFAAVDFDVQPAQFPTVDAYFAAFAAATTHPEGVYGSAALLAHVAASDREVKFYWQTEAWSGVIVSPLAHLYQRVGITLPAIPGAQGIYDENVVLKVLPWWTAAPVPVPTPTPQPKPPAKDDLMWYVYATADSTDGTIKANTHWLLCDFRHSVVDGAPAMARFGPPFGLSGNQIAVWKTV